MEKLHQRICKLVAEGRSVVGQHASEQLEDLKQKRWSC